MQQPAARLAITLARFLHCFLHTEAGPCMEVLFSRYRSFKAGTHHLLGSPSAGRDAAHAVRGSGGKSVGG